jgi:hypothetical protein
MRTMVVALTLSIFILAGCSSANSTKTESVTPDQVVSARSSTGGLLAINEVGLGANGYVALTNFTDQPVGMGGLFLCQGTKCFELPNTDVSPGVTIRVAVGDGAGLSGVVATQATIGELRSSDGEVALYSSRNVNDPKAMLVYLEWGSTPHADTRVAIDAGLWIKGSFAPSSDNATRIFRNEGGLWLFDAK